MATEKMTKLATEAAANGTEKAKQLVEQTTVQAKKFMEEGAAQTRVAVEKGMEQASRTAEGMFKAAGEVVEFGRGNFEAMTRATQTYVAGAQDLQRQGFALIQGLTDHALEGAKALAAVKSLKEAADIQATYAKAALEKAMAESAKLSEAAFKLAEQSAAPIAARVTVAVEKFSKPLAA
jgi:phasin family protein